MKERLKNRMEFEKRDQNNLDLIEELSKIV